MPKIVFISYADPDLRFAEWLANRLRERAYRVVGFDRSASEMRERIIDDIQSAHAVLVLLSVDSADSQQVMMECAQARQFGKQLRALLIGYVDALPWYFEGLTIADFISDPEVAFDHLLTQLPSPKSGLTLGEAYSVYLQREDFQSQHTLASYRRAIEMFFDFLSDRSFDPQLPIQHGIQPEELLLDDLSEDDIPIFLNFAHWLFAPSSGRQHDRRPYRLSTVELRLAGVQHWFHFLDEQGWLPLPFDLDKAKTTVWDKLHRRQKQDQVQTVPERIDEVTAYYDGLPLPPHLRRSDANPDRVRRWELTRLRNSALLHALADTGGRISEILSLNVSDFLGDRFQRQLQVEVIGKGGHTYHLNFSHSLAAIHAYLTSRSDDPRVLASAQVPLFVSHDPRYDGNRMSRVVAWRVVQRAARALGLREITPHDFRHWRAMQLLSDGHSIDEVQDYLGHRSAETTRLYYAQDEEENSSN
jgi:site-specific recombinase XerD